MSTYDLTHTGAQIDSTVDTLQTILTQTTAAPADILQGKKAVTSTGLITGTLIQNGGSGIKKMSGTVEWYHGEELNFEGLGFMPTAAIAWVRAMSSCAYNAIEIPTGSTMQEVDYTSYMYDDYMISWSEQRYATFENDGIYGWTPFVLQKDRFVLLEYIVFGGY